jgi:uncharacterized protein YciI
MNVMLMLFAAAALGVSPPPANGLPAAVPADIAPHVPQNLRSYFLAFLTTPAEAKDMSAELFARHQAYIRKQVEAGYIRLVGPIAGHDRLRGMKLISAATLDDARAIAGGDPAVQAKVLDFEVYQVTLPSLEGFGIRYAPRP